MYFFSNSPVKWRLTKVVCKIRKSVEADRLYCPHVESRSSKEDPSPKFP